MKTFDRFLLILFTLTISDKSPSGLRRTFEKLGPTFVKLGQLLASRPDIVPKDYSEEFRKLLDHEEPLSFLLIKNELEKSLGNSLNILFRSFEEVPLSSASIGQVHKATLKNGKVVAVKIRRPGIKEQITEDVKILNRLASVLNTSPFFQGIGFKKLVTEFTTSIWEELDFTKEAHKAKRLAENLKHYAYVEVPRIEEEYTRENILIMEYLEGITINELLNQMQTAQVTDVKKIKTQFKINLKVVVSEAIDTYIFKQILEDGFFHGDPHPANIIILPNDKIGFVDFGIMGTLDRTEHREALILILSIIENDPASLTKALTSVSEKTLTKKEEMEITDAISDELHKIHGSNLSDATIGDLALSIISVGRHFNLHWSSGIIMCLRAIAEVEGIALRLIPEASIVDLIKPHLRKYLAQEALSKFSEEEVYKNLLKGLEFAQDFPSISDIIGEKGLKVETIKD